MSDQQKATGNPDHFIVLVNPFTGSLPFAYFPHRPFGMPSLFDNGFNPLGLPPLPTYKTILTWGLYDYAPFNPMILDFCVPAPMELQPEVAAWVNKVKLLQA